MQIATTGKWFSLGIIALSAWPFVQQRGRPQDTEVWEPVPAVGGIL